MQKKYKVLRNCKLCVYSINCSTDNWLHFFLWAYFARMFIAPLIDRCEIIYGCLANFARVLIYCKWVRNMLLPFITIVCIIYGSLTYSASAPPPSMLCFQHAYGSYWVIILILQLWGVDQTLRYHFFIDVHLKYNILPCCTLMHMHMSVRKDICRTWT